MSLRFNRIIACISALFFVITENIDTLHFIHPSGDGYLDNIIWQTFMFKIVWAHFDFFWVCSKCLYTSVDVEIHFYFSWRDS